MYDKGPPNTLVVNAVKLRKRGIIKERKSRKNGKCFFYVLYFLRLTTNVVRSLSRLRSIVVICMSVQGYTVLKNLPLTVWMQRKRRIKSNETFPYDKQPES